MDDKLQELLKQAWTQGRTGHLSAWSEAKAWALREVWRETHTSDHGLGTHVAGKLRKVGGGQPTGEAVMKLFRKMDADADWFPGKSLQEEFGPAPVLSGIKRHAIAKCAMNMKSRGVEPTYARVVAACPQATLNPETERPVAKKRVYEVFREECYDEDPEEPWTHKARYSKVALTEEMMSKRLAFANYVLAWGHNTAYDII